MSKMAIFYGIVAILLGCSSCDSKERVILRPEFAIRNSNTLEIDKIVLNDSATVFYIDAFYRPRYWIRIDSGTYLRDGEKTWPIVGAKGIKLNGYHWMPDSGKSSFQLIFPPLGKEVKQVDFIESDCKDCFKIWGIPLRAGAKVPDLSALVPEEFKQLDIRKVSELPEPELKYGTTRLKIHLLGYRKELGGTGSLYVNNFLTNEQEEYSAPISDDGIWELSYEQYGIASAIWDVPFGGVSLIIEPGVENEVYIDLGVMTRSASPYQVVDQKMSYYKGKYAVINTLQTVSGKASYYFQGHSEEFFRTIYPMNAEQYTDYVMQEYNRLTDSIRNDSSLAPLEKEWMINRNKAEAMAAILSAAGRLEIAHRIQDENSGKPGKEFEAPKLTDKHYKRLKDLNLNDPRLLYLQTFVFSYPGIYTLENWKDILEVKEGILVDLEKIRGVRERITNLQPLTSEQESRLQSMDNPFYLNAFRHMLKVQQEEIAAKEAKEGYRICEVPQVAKEKLFETILARYKGKVVFVDFWATWCGPCRAAIREMEPLKAKELKNDQLAFVYLTGETSPSGNWRKMIPDIRGDHYRLSNEQWNYVCDQFGIEGIPSYVLVDKKGNSKLREDLRNHDALKKVLLQKLSE